MTNSFGFDLYARVRARDKNLILSPASAAIALAMTAAGARGETQEQIAKVLHVKMNRLSVTHPSFSSLIGTLNDLDGKDGLVLSVASRLWGQQDVTFRPEFLALLRSSYRAPLGRVDFKSATQKARSAINRWAAGVTHNRIQEPIGPGLLTPETRLTLVNAVYAKGKWRRPFPKAATQDGFFLTPNGKVTTKMMTQTADLAYARLEGLQLVELPYRGGLSMVVFFPDASDGLDSVEDRMAGDYSRCLMALGMTRVKLELPSWKVRSDLNLDDTLKAMGMTLAFQGGDFSGMNSGEALRIDKFIQVAVVETNEEGTEAVAVTAGGVQFSAEPDPIELHIDRPFLYVIRDPKTGVILFIGRVVDPR